jgi:hypothetical protein
MYVFISLVAASWSDYGLFCCGLFLFFAEQGGSEGFFRVPKSAAHAAQIVLDDWG